MRLAPELEVSRWFNTDAPLTLGGLRGKVVVIEAFQMLCPGCVARGIPQAQRIAGAFPSDLVQVIGLHTVFEHHAAMSPISLEAFLHEYRVQFPVGVDVAADDGNPTPKTMRAYAMKGTPTLILVDARGRLRSQVFGSHEDLVLGAEIATLIAEAKADAEREPAEGRAPQNEKASERLDCSPDACPKPD